MKLFAIDSVFVRGEILICECIEKAWRPSHRTVTILVGVGGGSERKVAWWYSISDIFILSTLLHYLNFQ